jgi:hypothetical protein
MKREIVAANLRVNAGRKFHMKKQYPGNAVAQSTGNWREKII